MPQLPTLVHDKKTKVGGEVLVYYNLDSGRKIGSLVEGASGVEKNAVTACGGSQSCPSGAFPAAVIAVPNTTSIAVSDGPTFEAQSPVGAAGEIDTALSEDINSYDMTASTVGDSVDIWCLPDPSNDVLICFEQGFSPATGERFRAVPRKFNPADHYVRQRSENTISLTDIFVSAWDGIQRLNGLTVTLVAKIYPDGGATPSQINYYPQVRLNVPSLDVPGEANDSIEITGEGNFEEALVFAAKPS